MKKRFSIILEQFLIEVNKTMPNKNIKCEYWEELQFRKADQVFDAGEFSSSFQYKSKNVPCQHCETCALSMTNDSFEVKEE